MGITTKNYLSIVIILLIILPLHSQIYLPMISDATPPPQVIHDDPIGKPYGGGSGYFPIITPEESDIVVRSNDFEYLKATIANASYGDVIYINDNLNIEIPFQGTLVIPDGVTLASGRGRNGSKGALLFSNNFLIEDYYYVFLKWNCNIV